MRARETRKVTRMRGEGVDLGERNDVTQTRTGSIEDAVVAAQTRRKGREGRGSTAGVTVTTMTRNETTTATAGLDTTGIRTIVRKDATTGEGTAPDTRIGRGAKTRIEARMNIAVQGGTSRNRPKSRPRRLERSCL